MNYDEQREAISPDNGQLIGPKKMSGNLIGAVIPTAPENWESNPYQIKDLTIDPQFIEEGQESQGEVEINRAVSGPIEVNLDSSARSSDNADEVITKPNSVTVNPGSKRANFPIQAHNTPDSCSITASYGNAQRAEKLVVRENLPHLVKMELDKKVVEGGEVLKGKVFIDEPATKNTEVDLSCNQPDFTGIQERLIIKSGDRQGQFTFRTNWTAEAAPHFVHTLVESSLMRHGDFEEKQAGLIIKPPQRDLDSNAKNVGFKGSSEQGRDPEEVKGMLPFTEDGKWDGDKILKSISQLDNDPLTLNDSMRCAAASILAVHIMGGPDSVVKVAGGVGVEMIKQLALEHDMPSHIRANFHSLYPIMLGIPQKITQQTATYEDLKRVAYGLKITSNWAQNDGSRPDDYNEMIAIGGAFHYPTGMSYKGWEPLKNLAWTTKQLNQSFILDVSTNKSVTDNVNHAVTLGYNGSDVYLYDPWPREGSQIMYWSKDKFDIKEYFEHANGTRHKWFIRQVMKSA